MGAEHTAPPAPPRRPVSRRAGRAPASLRPWVAEILRLRYPDEPNLDELVERIVRHHLAQRAFDDYAAGLEAEIRTDAGKLEQRRAYLLDEKRKDLDKRFGLTVSRET